MHIPVLYWAGPHTDRCELPIAHIQILLTWKNPLTRSGHRLIPAADLGSDV